MTFSQAQYQAAIDKINSGMSDLSGKIPQVIPTARSAVDHWYVPSFVAEAVMWLANEVVNIAETIWNTLVELLKGAAAPVTFFADAFHWDDVKGLTSDVAGELSPTVLPSSQHWTGAARQAYAQIIPPQSAAATRLGDIANSTAGALVVCAVAGLAFYVALGLILAQFIITMIGVIAALGSVAFSWAGVALAVGDTTVSAGFITTAVTALIGVLTAQAQQMVSLHGQTVDNSVFPGGRWPNPNTSSFNYAS